MSSLGALESSATIVGKEDTGQSHEWRQDINEWFVPCFIGGWTKFAMIDGTNI